MGLTYLDTPRRKSRAARLTLAAPVVSPCGKGMDRRLDIAPEWDTAKNDMRNGGVDWPSVAGFDKLPEPDGRDRTQPSIR